MKDRICILSSEKFANRIKEDILLKNELLKNFDCEIVAWESINKENINYYSVYVIKSVWGYHNQYLSFLNLIEEIEKSGIPVFNSYKNVLFDISKYNQIKFLIDNNVPTIPTVFLSEFSKEKLNIIKTTDIFVTKPSISASGENTKKIKFEEIMLLKDMYSNVLCNKEQDILIQPFIDSVVDGEISCIVINDTFQYAVRRYPGVFTDEKKIEYLYNISSSLKIFIRPIIEILKERELLFYRIDLIEKDDSFLVVELEMIDPDLLIRNIPENLQIKTVKMLTESLKSKIDKKD